MKIALVGANPESKHKAPFDDKTWEIWAFSKHNRDLPRFDRWFELHRPEYNRAISTSYCEWVDRLPNATHRKDFPFDDLERRYGPHFFMSSIAWLMGYALAYHQPSIIGIWGVEAVGKEYWPQRPGIWFFARMARDAGIDVIAPGSTVLDPPPLYGGQMRNYLEDLRDAACRAKPMPGNGQSGEG